MGPESSNLDAPGSGHRDPRTVRLEEWVCTAENLAREVRQLLVEHHKLSQSGMLNDPHAVATWLRRRANAIESTNGLLTPIEGLITAFEDAAREAQLRLEADLREALEQRGWKVDGQWPRLYVERVIRVEVDEKGHRVIVGERNLPTFVLQVLVAAVQEQLRGLLPARFDPKRFIGTLADCHDQLASPEERGVPIWELYRQLLISHQPQAFWRSGRQSLFRPLSEQTFRACLTKLLEHGPLETANGRELKLLPPLKVEDAMYLYHPAEHRFAFVGRVAFLTRRDQSAP